MGIEPGTRCFIEAPCKINLHLRVKGRRPDGFHELESVFIALAWGDTLEFEVLSEEGVCEILLEGAGVIAREKNLVYRAVSLFRERTGFRPGLRARLTTGVPLGSGFGGGSSDAAAALRALERLAGGGFSREFWGELAQVLGSDVPFFLEGGAAWVTGRGEGLRRLPVPPGLTVVLVHPGVPSPTAGAFALLDRFRENGLSDRGEDFDPRDLPAILGGEPRAWPFGNDFLPVFLAQEGEAGAVYREILGDFAGLGAEFSSLSGSGSGCFGVFTDGGTAERAVKTLKRRWNFVRPTFFLACSPRAVVQ
jgi:4-diphosphocytidyl-2-C-methyl-D-erythritol kinase